MGAKVKIGKITYVAEDTGVIGKSIDIFVSSHQLVLKKGVRYKKGYLIKKKK